jgi:hypothetical protein
MTVKYKFQHTLKAVTLLPYSFSLQERECAKDVYFTYSKWDMMFGRTGSNYAAADFWNVTPCTVVQLHEVL